MSSAPQLSLDERERRAEERAQQLKSGNLSPKGPSRSGSARGAPAQEFSPTRGIPKPGESLFDNYAALQDPTKFSTDEEEVQDLLRMGVGYGQGERSAANEAHLEAGWDPSPHKGPPAYLKLIKVRARALLLIPCLCVPRLSCGSERASAMRASACGTAAIYMGGTLHYCMLF